MFDSLNEMKEYLLENFAVELSPADNEHSFKLGYIAGRNRRIVMANDSNLVEAYSMAKDGWVTFWTEAADSPAAKYNCKGMTKRARSDASDDDGDNESFCYILFEEQRYSQQLYDMSPKIPFFTGLKAGQERNNSSTSTPAVRAITTATTSSRTTEAITTTVSMPQSMESK
ncbi:Hypothetical predicted protein, partial [Paramuricea clavata]